MADDGLVVKRARDEAARWYAKLNNTLVSTDTIRAFREWRKDPLCDTAYLETEEFWVRANRLRHDQDIKAAEEEALNRTAQQMIGPLSRPNGRGPAAALLVAGVGVAIALGWQAYAGDSYGTAIGEQRLVTLKDGSRIRLDTSSRVRVRLRSSERQVELAAGQAFFEVAPDPSRPFVVRADGAAITALGTRFDVSRRSSGVEVTLVEGKVRVDGSAKNRKGSWTLKPGEQVMLSADLPAPRIRAVDAGSATSWTTGRLVFQGAPLSEAVAEVNRYSRRKVVLQDPKLAATTVSGAFDSGDIEAFVAAVSNIYGVTADRSNDREIRLKPAA